MWRNLFVLAGCVPVFVLLAAVLLHRWKERRRGSRLPVTEKLLRPAGYSLSRRLVDLGDTFAGCLFGAYFASLISVGLWKSAPEDFAGELVWLGIFGIAAATCTVAAWRKWREIQRVRLGLLGEQAMAEQLQILCAKGYQIFHDLKGDGDWNVDHVAVGPAGVFVIETKARTKRPGSAGEPDYRVSFDGRLLRFPGYVEKKAPEQARANARWVATMLSKATGGPVRTRAILALPGWMVDLTTRDSDVKVLSGKQVSGFIAAQETKLSERAITQITYQLEQRCRDVEF